MKNPDSRTIGICYHPTTTVFVDDNRAFLDGMRLALDGGTPYRLFCAPQEAIAYVNDRRRSTPSLGERYLVPGDGDDCAPYRFKLDLEAIERKLEDPERFQEPTVMVVDYAMPGLNGLEVCRAVDNPNIRKILLTGMADEHIAVEALNDKVIDYYIKKGSNDLFERIDGLIAHYQQQFFLGISKLFQEGLKANCQCLDDPALGRYFFDVVDRHSIVEYYFHGDSYMASIGYRMFTDRGEAYRLVLFTEDDLNAHMEFAVEADAPAALIDRLGGRTHAPLFPTGDGVYRPSIGLQWQRFLFPVERVTGRRDYFAVFVKEADMGHVTGPIPNIHSLREHLLLLSRSA